MNSALYGQPAQSELQISKIPSPSSEINLKEIPFRIVYESFRETDGKQNWEICMINADGSDMINLTQTSGLDEMYPHASPDGKKLCFVVDEGTNRRNKVRSVYYMDIDGGNRILVARNARQPCWSPDGKKIAYLKGEFDRYNTSEYATSGLVIYDLQTGRHRPHPNTSLHHLYAICWSPDNNWFLGVVKGNTRYSDAILVFEANGIRVFDLARWGVKGCRPDFCLDGKNMTWGETDWDLCIGDINLNSPEPSVGDIRKIVQCRQNYKIYHVDFSPDGKYVAFSYGSSRGGQQVGGQARGWNICVTDLSGKWVKVTTDGKHNKEPDWVPISGSDSALN
ncbi:MAG: PD40 domain-containing protein [Sedimentisphaerales bacterium]|nr:PD40 domain-containing protein [Sedimentisphaerales bacterium]